MNNYILRISTNQACTQECMLCSKNHINTIMQFFSANQTEYNWSRDYLAHCCTCRIAGKISEFHSIAAICEFYARIDEKACGGHQKNLLVTGKAFGQKSIKDFILKMLYFCNQSRKFSPVQLPKYPMDEVIVRVTTPTYHTHEPLGIQTLARTLVHKRVDYILSHCIYVPMPKNTPYIPVNHEGMPPLQFCAHTPPHAQHSLTLLICPSSRPRHHRGSWFLCDW